MADTSTNILERYGVGTISLEQLNEIWSHYDADGSGFIEVGAELDRFLMDLLRAGGREGTALELSDFRTGVLDMFDPDGNGKLDYGELEQLLNS